MNSCKFIIFCHHLHVIFNISTEVVNFSISVENVDDLERPSDVFLSQFTGSQHPALSMYQTFVSIITETTSYTTSTYINTAQDHISHCFSNVL